LGIPPKQAKKPKGGAKRGGGLRGALVFLVGSFFIFWTIKFTTSIFFLGMPFLLFDENSISGF